MGLKFLEFKLKSLFAFYIVKLLLNNLLGIDYMVCRYYCVFSFMQLCAMRCPTDFKQILSNMILKFIQHNRTWEIF